MPEKRWPPPGFPLVEGDYLLTKEWSIDLPERFARRVEDGSLVLWRPGLTLWLAAWGNDHGESRGDRLAKLEEDASPERFAERESETESLTRYSFRLLDESEDGPVHSLSAYALNDNGHLQMAVYFDDPADEEKARPIVESVENRKNL